MLETSYQLSKVNVSESVPTIRSVPFLEGKLDRRSMSLLVETAGVVVAAILIIRFFLASAISREAWLVIPGIWVAAALIPTAMKGRKFTPIGLSLVQMRRSLTVLGYTCVVLFPGMFLVCWLSKSFGLELPLRPALPQVQAWIPWLVYQFMYIAVAEEVFFRGYVQSNILKLAYTLKLGRCSLQSGASIVISAAVFAVAHIIIQGQLISALTFFPGLIFGWVFIRTKSLSAPILLHGLANTLYCILPAIFT